MDLEAFLDHLNQGKKVQGGSEAHQFMHDVSQEALRITAEINGRYHEPEELRALFSELIGRPVFWACPPVEMEKPRRSLLCRRIRRGHHSQRPLAPSYPQKMPPKRRNPR